MHKRLDDILMYPTHNEGKSEFDVRFIRNWESIIYKKWWLKSYLRYLNKLVDEYNNTYYHSIAKETIDADYSSLTRRNGINS